MAEVTLPALALQHEFVLPDVCVVSGRDAARTRRMVLSRTPLWVWATLLLTPLIFIPAYVFATERFVGRLPIADELHRRTQILDVARWAALAAAGVITVLAVLGPLPTTAVLTSVLPLALFAGLSARRSRFSITGRLGPGPDEVTLSGVAPRFVNAVAAIRVDR